VSPIPRPKPKEKLDRMSINIGASLHRAFKVATAAQGTTMTDVLLEFIREYVKKYSVNPDNNKERA
jgi:ParG protein